MARKKRKKNRSSPKSYNTPINEPSNKNTRKSFVVKGVPGNTGYYGSPITGEYLYKLDSDSGRQIFDEMRRSDPQIQANLQAITLPIRQATYYVEPGSDKPKDKEIAKIIENNLFKGMSNTWDDTIRHALLMLPFGFSILQKAWGYDEKTKKYKLANLSPRLPQSVTGWIIPEKTKKLTKVKQVDTNGEEYKLDIKTLCIFTNCKEGDNWEGKAILRGAYKPYYIKDQLEKILVINHDRNGVGIPVITVPQGVQPGSPDWKAAEELGENLYANEKQYIVLGADYKADILSGGEKTPDTLAAIKHYEELIAKSVLAMFINLGTSQTGSRALGMSFIEIFLMSLQAYADYICEVITRFCIKEYVDFNWYVESYPILRCQQIKKLDPVTLSLLGKTGFINPDLSLENTIRSDLHLPEREEKEPESTGGEDTGDQNQKGREKKEDIKACFHLKVSDEKKRMQLDRDGKYVDVYAVDQALDIAEKKLSEKLVEIKEEQREKIIQQLVAGRKVRNIRVIRKKEMYELSMKAFKENFKDGEKQVKEELSRQGMKIKGMNNAEFADNKKEYDELYSELLEIEVEGASSKLVNTVSKVAVDAKSRLQLEGEALERYLLETATISDVTWTNIASSAVNRGWGGGRDSASKKYKDQIDYAYYSSVLELATCEVCAPLDGTKHEVGDERYITPNPECKGTASKCQCMTIYVSKLEEAGEEEFEKAIGLNNKEKINAI